MGYRVLTSNSLMIHNWEEMLICWQVWPQFRGTSNRMEKWANMNFLKINKGNKGKCKLLPRGLNNLSTG